MTGCLSDLYLCEWKLTDADAKSTIRVFEADNTAWSCLEARFEVRRDPGFYLSRIVSTLAILMVLSLCTFMVAVKDVGDRLDVTLTLSLTIVAFQMVIGDLIPKVTYMTYLDKCFLTSFIAVAFIALESAALHFLSSAEERILWIKPTTAGFVDTIVIWPYAILCFAIIGQLYLRGHWHVRATNAAVAKRAALLEAMHSEGGGGASPDVPALATAEERKASRKKDRRSGRGRSPSPKKRRRPPTARAEDATPRRRSTRLQQRNGGHNGIAP